jgi:hypothetical protein
VPKLSSAFFAFYTHGLATASILLRNAATDQVPLDTTPKEHISSAIGPSALLRLQRQRSIALHCLNLDWSSLAPSKALSLSSVLIFRERP